MEDSLKPSSYMLQKAWKFGQKMAMTDRRIKPVLFDAHEYSSYVLFLQIHRHRLEQSHAFRPWDDKLQFMIEREANSHDIGLDHSGTWDDFYNQVALPIRNSFWYGWELVYRLEDLYRAQVKLARQDKNKPEVIRVYAPPVAQRLAVSTLPDENEMSLWEKVATKLFGSSKEGGHESPTPAPQAGVAFTPKK